MCIRDSYSEGAGARNHAKAQFNGNLGDASVHFYVDEKEIYQCLELTDGPWSVGCLLYTSITNGNRNSCISAINSESLGISNRNFSMGSSERLGTLAAYINSCLLYTSRCV